VYAVAAVVRRQQARGLGGAADGTVEVDHAVERAARADPLVSTREVLTMASAFVPRDPVSCGVAIEVV
jgi:hypothetical protein